MSAIIRHLTTADYVLSQWSGGSTTQLAIEPPGAVYAERDFLWRLSSAVVELEQSDFTPLPDYHRFIAPLRGDMTLTHGDAAPILLTPYDIHFFDGAAQTRSQGRCVDFNLMLRKGICNGELRVLHAVSPGALALPLECFDAQTLAIFCAEGGAEVALDDEQVALAPGECALLGPQPGLTLTAAAPSAFLIAWMWK